MAGVALGAKVMPVRVLDHCGGESTSIVDAATWISGGKINGAPASKNPTQILNLGVGNARVCPRFYQKAVNVAVERGSIVVAAVGNFNEDARNAIPTSCKNVATVGATTSTRTRSLSSSYGNTIEISAPGGDSGKNSPKILSATDESQTAPRSISYFDMVSTSQAAPHTSGTIALMLAANPDLKTTEIVTILQSTATLLPRCDRKSCGAGIVDTVSAVAKANSKSAKPSSKLSAKPNVTSGRRTLRLGN